jgi:hypothetical protein
MLNGLPPVGHALKALFENNVFRVIRNMSADEILEMDGVMRIAQLIMNS